ncbi:FG-GAP-like repeat-containing protein [Streptomyces sp. Isolate_45]|uniref:FG-GAP-like repeat-containing protein n=1 Tax=Streptomyces sp. Isolate_45 TaxID=2950111 RepID=UPI002481EA94|nr:FG-GAP-like repeat-containing protein [Streptomyces sp. Isolate_45]MDA5280893.1 FG-GAP-like repeat-containing protein [Streptomyces sp. Isolate_45]
MRIPALVFAVATVMMVATQASATGTNTTGFGTAANLDDNGRGSSAVAIGDLDNDGTPDLVTAIRAEGLGVFLGSGGGSFGGVTKYAAPLTSTSRFLNSAEIRDVNGDGHKDVISQDARGNVALVWLGDGSGALGAGAAVELNPTPGCDTTGDNPCVARFPVGVAVGDFDEDGKPDLATSNANTNNVSVVLGNGDGTFGAATGFGLNGGTNPQGVAAADLNGDGHLDLVTSNASTGTLSVLSGDGDGGFGTASSVSAGLTLPSKLKLADVNEDGKQDAVLVAPGTPGRVAVLLGDGAGGFGTANLLSAGSNLTSASVSDLNGDGHVDLVVSSYGSNEVGVFEGDGTGAFGSPLAFGLNGGTNPQATAVADLDGDGRPDVVTANSNSSATFVKDASVLLNATNRTPTAANDSYGHVGADTPLVVGAPGVLGNDTDPDGNTLTASLVTGPAHGTLSLNADGSFNYQPGSAYTGSDSFTYKATDGTVDSNIATVTINVSTGCNGLAATITGNGIVSGTSGSDVIVTGNGNDAVAGNGGNDTICTFGGNDAVSGGSGNDHLDGGDGNDAVSGGSGNDTVKGGVGDDALSGGSGDDTVVGGSGSDTLSGGSDTDVCAGDANGGSTLPGTDSIASGGSCETVVEVP